MTTETPTENRTENRTRPSPPKVDRLPPWRVLLHNDDVNDMDYVVETIMQLVAMRQPEAIMLMIEAHRKGLTLLTVTHREHAELLAEQFASKRIAVTIEPG